MTDKIVKLNTDNELVAENPETGEKEPVSFEGINVEGGEFTDPGGTTHTESIGGAGSLEHIETQTPNEDAEFVFTNVFDEQATYIAFLENLFVGGGNFNQGSELRVTSDGGSSFDDGSSDYLNSDSSTPSSRIQIADNEPGDETSADDGRGTMGGKIIFHNASNSSRQTTVEFNVATRDTGNDELFFFSGAGSRLAEQEDDGLKLTNGSSVPWGGGKIHLYKLVQ